MWGVGESVEMHGARRKDKSPVGGDLGLSILFTEPQSVGLLTAQTKVFLYFRCLQVILEQDRRLPSE